jgi:hypothetical protein
MMMVVLSGLGIMSKGKDILAKYNIEFHDKESYDQISKLIKEDNNYLLESLETLCLFIESQVPAIKDSTIKINGGRLFILDRKEEDRYLTLLFHSKDNMIDFTLFTPSRFTSPEARFEKKGENRSLYGTMYYLDLIEFLGKEEI